MSNPLPDLEDIARLLAEICYEPETGVFTRKSRSWNSMPGRVLGSVDRSGYARVHFHGTRFLAHRLAWFFVYGAWPSGEIDHINGVKSDNRVANLRDVSSTTNKQNQRKALKNNRTGYLGVFFQKANGLYCAQIKVNHKSRHLGYFKDPETASAAYLMAKRAIHEGCTL